MIYLYTLLGNQFSYPNVRHVLYKTYLQNKQFKYKFIDYTTYFLNEILVDKNVHNIEKIKHDIKDKNKDLLKANEKFIKSVNNYLNKFGIVYINNRGFDYKYHITGLDDFLKVSNDIREFTNLFPINKYEDDDIIFMNISFAFQLPMAINICKGIKNRNKHVKIIWNGNYLTQINKNCLELINKVKVVDAIIIFNHLKTFGNIIDYFKGKKVNLINTIVNGKKFELKRNIYDKYNLYYLDYSDIDLSKYLARDRIMPLLLSYGCYHGKCMFCTHCFQYGNYMKMNVKKTCEMVKRMYKENRFDSIVLVDECIPPKVILEFSKYLVENDIKTKWSIETRISEDYLDLEKVKLLVDSGCKFISFGVESYNKRILKLMDKGINIKDIKRVLKNFYMNGVIVSATFMVGFPGENYFNMRRTLYFINHFKYIDLFGLNVFVLARNSRLCDNLEHDCSDINITYRYKNDKKEKLEELIKNFKNKKKVGGVNTVQSKLLSRSDYLYLEKNSFSINNRKV